MWRYWCLVQIAIALTLAPLIYKFIGTSLIAYVYFVNYLLAVASCFVLTKFNTYSNGFSESDFTCAMSWWGSGVNWFKQKIVQSSALKWAPSGSMSSDKILHFFCQRSKMTRMPVWNLLLVSSCFVWVLILEICAFVNVELCQQNVLNVFVVVYCHLV